PEPEKRRRLPPPALPEGTPSLRAPGVRKLPQRAQAVHRGSPGRRTGPVGTGGRVTATRRDPARTGPPRRELPSGQPGPARNRGHLSGNGVLPRRGPGSGDRFFQFRRPELPPRPSGARHSGHLLSGGRPPSPHPYFTGANPDPDVAPASPQDHRSRPG